MILLDTHIWIWACESPQRLSQAQHELIADESNKLWISAISIWEAAMLCYRGRIGGDLDPRHWLDATLGLHGLSVYELTAQVACEANELPATFHRDPADRLIVATARVMGCPLLTSDRKIIDYPHVQTIH